MSHYLRLDLVRFLKAVDHALARPAEVVIIGGAACAIRYGVLYATRDIDTWSELSAGLSGAVARARETTGLAIPFGPAGVADGPHGFETRLVRVLPQLKRLRVRVPERHDLVLMKMVRGYEHDLEAAEAMHRRKALRLDTLLERYESEMGSVVGHPTRLRGNFLNLVERLFPQDMDRVKARLRSPDWADASSRPSGSTRREGSSPERSARETRGV